MSEHLCVQIVWHLTNFKDFRVLSHGAVLDFQRESMIKHVGFMRRIKLRVRSKPNLNSTHESPISHEKLRRHNILRRFRIWTQRQVISLESRARSPNDKFGIGSWSSMPTQKPVRYSNEHKTLTLESRSYTQTPNLQQAGHLMAKFIFLWKIACVEAHLSVN